MFKNWTSNLTVKRRKQRWTPTTTQRVLLAGSAKHGLPCQSLRTKQGQCVEGSHLGHALARKISELEGHINC